MKALLSIALAVFMIAAASIFFTMRLADYVDTLYTKHETELILAAE